LPVVEIEVAERDVLAPLFLENKRDTVLVRSVLEGHFGSARADSLSRPSVARLDSGSFTILGGDPTSPAVPALLGDAPIFYVTPESVRWEAALRDVLGDRMGKCRFTEFTWGSLDNAQLAQLSRSLAPPFTLKRVDVGLAKRLGSDTGNEYFYENFHSVEDFIDRGIGYCVLHEGRVASAATSMARCHRAIDIEIETVSGLRRSGLAAVAGARLVLHCLENDIEPHWLAANPASEGLALKLGYTRSETYETLEVER